MEAAVIQITILVAAVVLLSVFNYVLPTGADWLKPGAPSRGNTALKHIHTQPPATLCPRQHLGLAPGGYLQKMMTLAGWEGVCSFHQTTRATKVKTRGPEPDLPLRVLG